MLSLVLCAACAAAPPGGPGPAPAQAALAAAPVPSAPIGEAGKPIVFSWQDAGAARGQVVYRLTLVDLAERPLAERDTRERKYAATPDLESMFQPGATFFWQIAALDAEGRISRQSEPIKFTIK